MAKLLWGRVFFQDVYAGILREEPGSRTSFTYDSTYLDSGMPAISHTIPTQAEPIFSISELLPFFDNLVAEGWLEEAQVQLLGKRQATRFELLLAFGQDCAGAVSIQDPELSPLTDTMLDVSNNKKRALLTIRASLSGIQPKLMCVEKNGKFLPATAGELSTHIVKFPSKHHNDLVINEFITTQAFKALLPNDDVVNLWVGEVEGINEPALIIKRFDRHQGKRVHFEEFNQLLNQPSISKYEGAHKDMSSFILSTPGCLPAENYRLFLRILAGLLLGNTDMHLKNFAMLHTQNGLRLTPSYDQVAALIYEYKTIALAIGGSRDLPVGRLKAGNIIKLGQEFKLSTPAIKMAFESLAANKDPAIEAIAMAKLGTDTFKNKLIQLVEKRWNGTFALIGTSLSKKQ